MGHVNNLHPFNHTVNLSYDEAQNDKVYKAPRIKTIEGPVMVDKKKMRLSAYKRSQNTRTFAQEMRRKSMTDMESEQNKDKKL